jgi:phenylacetate-coenzyme A ligase PaaK-like adenylate-forming protein
MTERERIFSIERENDFESLAADIFALQYHHNAIYRRFCDALERNPGNIVSSTDIPFLPVEFFRDHDVVTGIEKDGVIFTSSGTTGMNRSRHRVTDPAIYRESFTRGFRLFFGDPSEVVILALLPSYMEREGSSLIYMVRSLINMSDYGGGFYLDDYGRLLDDLERFRKDGRRVILLGVTYALLDLAGRGNHDLSGVTVMETGGMKGHGREMVRDEVHSILCRAFNVKSIASEYGMTELLSQAWSYGDGLFRTPPWMRILIRDIYDPLSFNPQGERGGVSVIDLANINSCSFIATADLGIMHGDGLFEITGRYDNSDVRGCNLLVI